MNIYGVAHYYNSGRLMYIEDMKLTFGKAEKQLRELQTYDKRVFHDSKVVKIAIKPYDHRNPDKVLYMVISRRIDNGAITDCYIDPRIYAIINMSNALNGLDFLKTTIKMFNYEIIE